MLGGLTVHVRGTEGELSAQGESTAGSLRLAHAPPPALTGLRPDLPAAVDGVIAKALSKAPDDRYGTCLEFATARRPFVR